MKRFIAALFLMAPLALVVPAFADAPALDTGEHPAVANLSPFSEEAHFMSLAGLERYLTYDTSGVWLSRPEAVAIVTGQIEAAGR